jgi:hypothetical protein
LTYDELETELRLRFPALGPRLDEEHSLWTPDPVGGDILLADIFVPYFVQALREMPASPGAGQAGVDFLEELARNANPELRTVARISVLQALEDYPEELNSWVERFGPATRALLPTRDHGA